MSFDDERHEVELTAKRVSLTSIMPAGQDRSRWRRLRAESDNKRFVELKRFADAYRQHRVLIHAADNGQAVLELLRPARSDAPPHVKRELAKPIQRLVNVKSIDVASQEVAVKEDRPQTADLEVEVNGNLLLLAGDTLDGLRQTRVPANMLRAKNDSNGQPHGDRRNRRLRGWHLRQLLAKADIKKVPTSIELVSMDQQRHIVVNDELKSPERWPLLRANRRGKLKFELWVRGKKSATKSLRNVQRLVVRQQ